MTRVLINCLDEVNESMAGPAIRSWEFANILSRKYKVVLLTPNDSKLKSKNFDIVSLSKKTIKDEIIKADYLISQTIRPKIAKIAKKHNTKIIIDSYDPITIEGLEVEKEKSYSYRVSTNKMLLLEQNLSYIYASHVICASEKQRDYWLGVLSAMNRLTPSHYDSDNSLRRLIDVVPFGLSNNPPKKDNSTSLRSKFGLNKSDFVLLWGGGIWNWFDPLTLIKAVSEVSKEIPVKLVFMGTDHPNNKIERMEMVTKAMDLSNSLGLTNKLVFFNEGWVPYKERQQFLLDADVGVSMHFDHLETRFSFRTRILDYIWASLPIIATQGDSFAELIEDKELGIVVNFQDASSITVAIKELYNNKSFYGAVQSNLKNIQEDFYWEKCVLPIEQMIEHDNGSQLFQSPAVALASASLVSLYNAHSVVAKKLIKKVKIRTTLLHLKKVRKQYSNIDKEMRKK